MNQINVFRINIDNNTISHLNKQFEDTQNHKFEDHIFEDSYTVIRIPISKGQTESYLNSSYTATHIMSHTYNDTYHHHGS